VKVLSASFIREGSSDDGLIPLMTAVFKSQGADVVISPSAPAQGRKALHLWFDDIHQGFEDRDFILVHRDANSVGYSARLKEIETAHARSSLKAIVIPVIPVKETEAWLLHALYSASFCESIGIPAASVRKALPKQRDLPRVDAKRLLADVHTSVFAERGRKRSRHRIPRFEIVRGEWLSQLDDPALLESCESFQLFCSSVEGAIEKSISPTQRDTNSARPAQNGAYWKA